MLSESELRWIVNSLAESEELLARHHPMLSAAEIRLVTLVRMAIHEAALQLADNVYSRDSSDKPRDSAAA